MPNKRHQSELGPETSQVLSSHLSPYATGVLAFDLEHGLQSIHEPTIENISYLLTAMTGEVGELANVVKKIWRDGESPKLWRQFDEELVDILIYYIELLVAARVDIDEAWKVKEQVLKERWLQRGPYKITSRDLQTSRGELP